MDKTDIRYQAYIDILKEELIPAMGCTEPIALAYAAATARELLGAMPERVEVSASGSIIKNVKSHKMGKKDILKIDNDFEIDLDVLGYLDPHITVSIIKDGKTIEKKKLQLPKKIKNIEKCKNPRCITSIEEDLDQIFYLANEKEHIYRCLYCESRINKE